MTHRWTSHLILAGGFVMALYVAGVPILAYLPLLLFLACPVMMLVMMRAMAGHSPTEPSSPVSQPRASRDDQSLSGDQP